MNGVIGRGGLGVWWGCMSRGRGVCGAWLLEVGGLVGVKGVVGLGGLGWWVAGQVVVGRGLGGMGMGVLWVWGLGMGSSGGGWGDLNVGGLGMLGLGSRCHSIDMLPRLWLLHLFSNYE